MPVTKRAIRKAKPKSQKKSEDTAVLDAPERSTHGEDAASPSVFQTFETTATLSEGHCVVRKLEDGRYEILNFTSVEASTLGSVDVGRSIRADESGGRLKALEAAEKAWKDSEFKIGQVLGSANLRIFRLLKLPIELRLRIYDLTVCSNQTLYIGSWQYSPERILAGVQLRGTCRQIYDETRSLFWRNSFRINGVCEKIKPLLPLLTDNLRELTWDWWAFKIKDVTTLRMINGFKQLKIFHLRLTKYCVYSDPMILPGGFTRVNYLHQSEPAVARFRRTNGFDELLSLRGLELVTVLNHHSGDIRVASGDLSGEELNAFELFLNKQLTQPRQPEEVKEKAVKKPKKAAKASKKTLAKELSRELEGLL